MKRLVWVAFLPLLLASCSKNEPSSSEVAANSFAALEAAVRAMGEKTTLGITSDSFSANMGVRVKNEESSSDFTIRLERCAYDVRLKGLPSETLSGITASFLSTTERNPSGGKAYVSGDVPSFMAGLLGESGIPLNFSGYLDAEEGTPTFYGDMSKMALVRIALQTLIREQSGDDSFSLPQRFKVDVSENEEDVQGKLPLSQYFADASKELREALETSYEASPSSFSFASSGQAIMFRAASFDAFKDIVKAFSDDERIDSAFDTMKEDATLNRFALSLRFDESGLTHGDIDVSITFRETSNEESGYPIGTWELSSGVDFTYGEEAEPVALPASAKAKYQEITLPKGA
ncbi:MAG: hypothetical protein K6E59_01580 [Bacilli bacterium]|nr:hypothetical protein [Bacilli bacterium]